MAGAWKTDLGFPPVPGLWSGWCATASGAKFSVIGQCKHVRSCFSAKMLNLFF
jgi:hypothetical protein